MAWATACLLALAATAPAVVMFDKPVTATAVASEKARHSEIVLLQLEGVLMRRNAPAVWNVFWEMPAANTQTSVDNIHFVGYVTSLPNAAGRDAKPSNFTLELPTAAVEEVHRLRTMHFTFVPMGKPPEGGVTIMALRLE